MTVGGTVHVVDDDDGVLRTISRVLTAGGYDPQTYNSGVDFLNKLDAIEPGCVILDIRMPEIDGLGVQQIMQDRQIELPILILTGHADVDAAVDALKAGALDFLQKPFRKEQLLDAVQAAQSRLVDQTSRREQRNGAQAKLDELTPRETEILAELGKGLPHKVVAFNLGISIRTVEVHRAQILKKLDVRSLPEAIHIVFQAGR